VILNNEAGRMHRLVVGLLDLEIRLEMAKTIIKPTKRVIPIAKMFM
jgi:hypothetical protein